ncbi:MAG: MarR family transcriptional regulator [Candidatus Aenigmarchaeota archaeon]|nr:MarR family transcriptional regulator [Candidatus Aenigmarchaeota archaeon]
MNKLGLLIIFILCFSWLANAVFIDDMNVVMTIDENVVHTTVEIKYTNPVQSADYFVTAPVTDVKVFDHENNRLVCKEKRYDIGTNIICDNINETYIKFEFNLYKLVEHKGAINEFSYPFSITDPIKNFSLVVKLPVAGALIERGKIPGLNPFSPANGVEGSDGRRIFVKWLWKKPELGTTIHVSLFYEKVKINESAVLALVVLVAIIMIYIFFSGKKSSYDVVLPVLTRDERTVMEMVLKSDKGEVDQREIVRELDASKSKVTRIIKNLEERGLVKKVHIGRKNKIKLVKPDSK